MWKVLQNMKYKELINAFISELQCRNCRKYDKKDGIKLRCCKACMNTYYCNKYRQRRYYGIHEYKIEKQLKIKNLF